MQIAVILGVMVAATFSLTTWVVWQMVRGQSGVIQERLETYAARGPLDVEMSQPRSGFMARLDRLLREKSVGKNLALELAKADLPWRVSEFIVLSLLLALLGFLVGTAMLGGPALGALAALVGFMLPRLYVKRQQAVRISAFNDQLGDALSLIVSSLRSGYSMLQSMEVVASELPDPIGKEFARVVRECSLGLSQEQALDNLVRRIDSDDLDMFVTAVKVQHEVGGNLAEILDTISETIRERVRIQGEIRVLTAQQTMSAYLLIFLPFAVVLGMMVINRAYIMQLFEDVCGLVMVGVGLSMIGLGYLVMRKLAHIEV